MEDDVVLCAAKSSRSGQPCRKRPVKGATVCRTHGGAAPQVKAAAERRQNEVKALGRVAAMVQTYEGEHKDVDPLRQMSRMIFTSAAVERSLYQILDERGEFIEYVDYGNAGGSRREPSAEMKLWNEERDRLTKYCKAAIDAKMTDRQTALLKEDAEVVVNVFEAVFVDLRLDDATRQRARLSAQKHLLQVAANG